MIPKTRTPLVGVLTLAVSLVLPAGTAVAATRYLGDGAVQNNQGGFDLPTQGSCPGDTTQRTRGDCLALRYPAYTTSADCTAVGTGGATRSWSTGICNDLVNITQAACEVQPDRKWNNGVCAIVMLDDDRNNLTCALHGGTWVTAGTCVGAWIMPDATTYTPRLLTGNTNPGPGDQCLRCHNARTQYNSPRVRDTEDTLYMGHKNMARKVAVGDAWGGPPFACSNPFYTAQESCVENGGTWDPTIYPSDDSGNVFHWNSGTITVGGVDRDLMWIFGDWLSALPRAIYKAPASTTTRVCTNPLYTTQTTCEANSGQWVFTAGASYSCARCHTTGWTSDTTINTTKEPERSFPNITWDRNSNAPFGVVNLASGVSGDANQYSSWDEYGITCSRCHNSAVDDSTNGGVPPFTAAAGMSSHHNTLTAPDASSGVCTDTRWTSETPCTTAGGTWLTACSVNPTPALCIQAITTQAACTSPGAWVSAPAWCSNAFYTTQTACTANGFAWQDGWCTRPDVVTSGTCTGGSGTNALTWRANGSQASCQGAGATWSFSKCSLEGVCNKGSAYTSKAACEAVPGGQWAAATDIIRCDDAGGRWTGNNTNRGQIITSLCVQCHRQETGGLPYGATAVGSTVDYSATDPAGQLKVGPYHSSVTFLSHPHGNQFLNSPHGKFTGKFNEIATGKFNFAGTGLYKSFFQNDAEAANTGNGCTGCHEVHTSTVAGERPFREECTDCHAKNLGAMFHPTGGGTPLEHMATEPMEACVSCHMPSGEHLFRIKTDAAYSTFPMPGALTGTVNATTSPDGTYTKAVWVDLDAACGQCHGGGTVRAATTGSINAGSKTLTVASASSLAVGQRVRVTGAGSLYYDDEGQGYYQDLDSYVAAIAGTTITLAGNATVSVTNAAVVQNPTKNNAGYLTKTQLADLARGIHNDAPTVNFGYTLGNPNTLTVNVHATATCSGTCDAFEWSWGDGASCSSLTDPTCGASASHTYLTSGPKQITLTVEEFGVNSGTKTKTVTVYTPDFPPTVAGMSPCSSLQGGVNTNWTATFTDSSTDDHGISQVTVSWGDGSLLTTGGQNATFSHTYHGPGTYAITHKALDTIGQQKVETCTVVTAFTISGTVRDAIGTTLLAGAVVTVKQGTTLIATLTSAANGTFTTTNLNPGTYTLTVTRSGYTFPSPAATVTIGPSSSTNNIQSLGSRLIEGGDRVKRTVRRPARVEARP